MIQRVFNSYKSLDFTTEVKDANGAVELTTNALGDEIVKMLKQSSDFANALANESGKLQTAVQSLTTSSNSQGIIIPFNLQGIDYDILQKFFNIYFIIFIYLL